jgi:hypothetical protein
MGQTGGWIVTINFLESVALLLGLREILPLVAGGYKRLVCMIDNTAVVGQLNGSSKDDDMKLSAASPMPLLVYKEIAWLSCFFDAKLITTPKVFCLPLRNNKPAKPAPNALERQLAFEGDENNTPL